MENLSINEIIGIIIFIAIFLAFLNPGKIKNSNSNIKRENSENLKQQKKLQEKLKLLSLNMESLLIKKEEIENEINNLELEASMDFEKEAIASTKIKKLGLQKKHLIIKIKEMQITIDNLKQELGT